MSKQLNYSPNGIYHIFNHANGKENIFESTRHYQYFLTKYAEKLSEVVDTLAYCLMPNHFHLLIQVKKVPELLAFLEKKKRLHLGKVNPKQLEGADLYHYLVHRQFHNFLGGYSKAFNKDQNRKGSLLRQNTRRKMVFDESYLLTVIAYIHLNPVHHGFTVLPKEWIHSSYHAFLSNRPSKIPRARILQWFGGKEAFIAFHLNQLDIGLNEKLER